MWCLAVIFNVMAGARQVKATESRGPGLGTRDSGLWDPGIADCRLVIGIPCWLSAAIPNTKISDPETRTPNPETSWKRLSVLYTKPRRRSVTVTTVLALPEQRMLLRNVRWETYERLLDDHVDVSAPRFNFDRGTLEIMSPSSEHEEYKQALTLLVELLADGFGLDIRNLGSMTFKRSERERGFEADVCFYVQSAGKLAGKTHIDPSVDPRPDLVIEVEITAPALNKLPIYADFGVPEVWRYDGERLHIVHLHEGEYAEHEQSGVFPGISAEDVSRLVRQSLLLKRTEWLREIRSWMRGIR
jgi:Uma2 family endonuclease